MVSLLVLLSLQLVDVADQAGVTLVNVSGGPAKAFIVEVNGNGAAFFDYDEDGDPDLLIANGSTLDRLTQGGDPVAALYQNQGDGTFTDITEAAGVTARGWGMGVCVADYDNDGDEDFYLTAYGPNLLFRNRGDGTFVETAAASGVNDELYGTGCSFGDYDRDGNVDLYVANYLTFDSVAALERGETPDCQFMGMTVMCGPRHFAGEPDVLFMSRGDGTFENRTERAGIEDPGYYGFGVVSGDLDDDGWLDIYVANDSRPNFYFRNNGDGTFFDEALGAGIALNEEGRPEAGMGVDLGDYDNDGWLDVVVTNFSHETNTLYRGSAEGIFTDVTYLAGLGGSSIASLGWGVGLVDLDNDGWRDLFVANGHVYPEVDEAPIGTSWLQEKQLFRNESGRFRNVTEEVGGPLLEKASSRGVAFGDYDNDGDPDIFIVNLDAAPSLLRNDNDTDNDNGWLGVRLISKSGNRSAIGARVKLRAQTSEVRSGGSYLSHNDSRLHFGVGESAPAVTLTVRWPNGEGETIENVRVDQHVTIVEGAGALR